VARNEEIRDHGRNNAEEKGEEVGLEAVDRGRGR